MPIKPIVGIPGVPGAVGIWDDDPADIAAHAALTTGPHDLGATWFSKYIARGIARSGIPSGQACWFCEEFTDISRWQKTGGAGSLAAVTTLTGGVGEIAAPLGPDTVDYITGDAGLGSPSIHNGHGRFYCATRMRLPIAPPNDGWVLTGGFRAGLSQVSFGWYGPLDLTHFAMIMSDGVNPPEFLVSTVLLNIGWHNLEAWSNATNYYFSVDEENPLALVPVNPNTDNLGPFIQVTSGAGAGITADFDKLLYVFPQAS